MYIEFKKKNLRRQCESFAALRKAFGDIIAKQVVMRLNALKAADCIEDLDPLPPDSSSTGKAKTAGSESSSTWFRFSHRAASRQAATPPLSSTDSYKSLLCR